MKVGREETLKVLESVSAGLASKEIIEQSDCFVFSGDKICTFNDEICCHMRNPWRGVEGAIKAKPLIDILSKVPEDSLELEQTDSEVLLKGKNKRSGIRMEQEVVLPVGSVDEPTDWVSIPEDFSEAVDIVHACASTQESEFILTCVHIHPEYLETCDRFQIARYPLDIAIENPFVVRARSLKHIVGLDMAEMAISPSWLHFRNSSGLVMSLRRWLEEYSPLDKFLSTEDMVEITLPSSIEDIIDKAKIFSMDNIYGDRVLVTLKTGSMVIEGRGAFGWYKERKQVDYQGDPLKFTINPKLLLEVSKKANDCLINHQKIFIDTGKFQYTTSLHHVEDKES